MLQAASRFPPDARSPLQLRDVRPPALRSLPDPDAALSPAPGWAVPRSVPAWAADSLRGRVHSDGKSYQDSNSDESASTSGNSTSRAGVYIWHDASAERKDRPESRVSESGSSTQPAAWLQGIQQKAQQEPLSEATPEPADDEPREPVHLPASRL